MRGGSALFHRFFFSYLLIFLLPFSALSILGILQIEQNHLKEQLTLQRVSMEKDLQLLDYELGQMRDMTTSISASPAFSADGRADSRYLPYETMNFLNEKAYASLLSDNIFVLFPEEGRVYSEHGCMNYALFFEQMLVCRKHSPAELGALLQKGDSFVVDEVSVMRAAPSPALLYTQTLQGRNAGQGVALYVIDFDTLGSIFAYPPGQVDIYTALTRGEELFYCDLPETAAQTVLPLAREERGAPIEYDGERYYVVQASSERSGMTMTRLVAQSVTQLSAYSARLSVFIIGLALLTCLGGFCVAGVSRLTFRPILRLANMARLMAGEETVEKNELLYAERVILQLHERYSRSKRASLLLDLLYTDYHSMEQLRASPVGAAFPQSWGGYCVCVCNQLPPPVQEGVAALATVVDQVPVGSEHVLLFSLQKGQCEGFAQRLAALWERCGEERLQVGIGQVCDSPLGVALCYRQAKSARETLAYQKGRVAIYQEGASPLAELEKYPQEEIQTLCQMILQRDPERFGHLASYLLHRLRQGRHSMLFCISLCYNLINSCLDALGQTGLDTAGLEKHHAKLLQYPAIHSPGELLSAAEAICGDIEQLLRENTPKPAPQGPMQEVLAYIHSHYQEDALSAKLLAGEFGMSVSNLSHQFKKSMGVTLSEYVDLLRLAQARALLTQTSTTIEAIAQQCGFGSSLNLIRKIKRYYGMTPTEYRNLQ